MTPTEFLTFLRPTLHLSVCSTRQLAVLVLLVEAEKPIDFASVARNLKISKPSLSRHTDMLERRGFVERSWPRASKRDEDQAEIDNRKVFLNSTPDGLSFLVSMGVAS